MRITLLHNPKAGDGKHPKEELIAALANAGHRVVYQSTKKRTYKKALNKPADVVLVGGGDGTVAKVGRELIDSDVPLSILPLGTANNLAHSLGITGPADRIMRRLKDAKKRTFDVGVARGPWRKKYFFESVGGGLLADFVYQAQSNGNETEKLSKEQKLTRHVALLRQMLGRYPAREWKIDIDGMDISGRYILWEAMNIRSVGPALYLASPALTRDGRLDFVGAQEKDRSLFIRYLDAWLAGRKQKFPLSVSRFRKLTIELEKNSRVHFDGKLWPPKMRKTKRGHKIEIAVKHSALVILRPNR
jgi:diacylglycerol kinase (ATP)